ncbi:MAG: pseudouridylate synthase [Marinomonas sp.]|jgi:tRNA pseudouridine65 synthase|uniref:Pseudouridine synthase n=1 Tax=Marinomonas communis TaxID=28254 RepID=A0A4R6XE20_9GAMM|nr:RluA family pseudouridine synthase [Marinomonas communis]RUM48959.1 MAG: pseudouridylate synthase [Marinomonas sp.]RUM49461.1 MAG: pseudouridylate synthase [Marinomonas sp.]TDR15253.1 tRNA pseudouridine synthase C [Marinomonas communis]
MTLDILYLDDDLVVVNKPSGLLVHRTDLAKHEQDAVVQRLNEQLGKWVYPIHRLDRATSGVLVMALKEDVAGALGEQFMARTTDKVYQAIVRGYPQELGTIDYPLAKLNEEKGRSRFKIEGTEKPAVSHFKTLERYEINIPVSRYPKMRLSLVEVKPEQGRTHQIRRHFKHVFHPLLGDTRYGCRHHNQVMRQHWSEDLRLMLHAKSLTFKHPTTQSTLSIEAPLEQDMKSLLSWLEKHPSN